MSPISYFAPSVSSSQMIAFVRHQVDHAAEVGFGADRELGHERLAPRRSMIMSTVR